MDNEVCDAAVLFRKHQQCVCNFDFENFPCCLVTIINLTYPCSGLGLSKSWYYILFVTVFRIRRGVTQCGRIKDYGVNCSLNHLNTCLMYLNQLLLQKHTRGFQYTLRVMFFEWSHVPWAHPKAHLVHPDGLPVLVRNLLQQSLATRDARSPSQRQPDPRIWCRLINC